VSKYLIFKYLRVIFGIACLLPSLANAELIFSAPPRESPQAAEKLYGPLAKHLTELLGEPVVFQYPKNWLQYQRDLRKGVYDIVFDGPHFVSWRLAHLEHQVLVKLPGELEFVVVVKDDSEMKRPSDLIGKRICAIPPPNLATLTVINLFNNPVRQPVIWGVKGGYPQVFKHFQKGTCVAAVFRTTYYEKKLTQQQRSKLRILHKSKGLPNQAITVGKKIGNDDKKKIIRSLTLGKGKKAIESIAKRFGGEKSSFITASQSEYKSQTDLLEGVVFGW